MAQREALCPLGRPVCWAPQSPQPPWGHVSARICALSRQCSPPLSSRTRLLLGISKASRLRKLRLAFWASFQAGALPGFAAFPWSGRSRLLLLRAQPPLLCQAGQGLQGRSPGVCVPLDGAACYFIVHLTLHMTCRVFHSDSTRTARAAGEQPSPAVLLAEGL